MRKALNENPVVQIVFVGLLVVVGGLLLATRMGGGGSSAPAPATPSPVASSAPAAGSPSGSSLSQGGSANTAVPLTAEVAPLAPGAELPRKLVASYAANQVIVLLIVRNGGIDDGLVRDSVESLRGLPGVGVFVAHSRDIARYAQLTAGVGVDRVPALVVVQPRAAGDAAPKARVLYGFRSAESVRQAVRDALYNGPHRSYDP